MELPNFFLADLPPEAELSPTMLGEACLTLRRNREQYLAHRSTQSLVNLLFSVAKDWLQPEYAFRKLALERGPAALGFSAPTLKRGLDGFFKELTPESFHALLEQDLGHADRLDRFCARLAEEKAGRAALARGPQLLVHVAAGNVPNPTMMSMVLGVLVRSAQFVKCASGTAFLPRLFAHSLYEADPKLGACLEVAEWRGGNAPLEAVLFAEADCITATGSDETLAEIRKKLCSRTRFLGYGHQVSFGYIGADLLSGATLHTTANRAADDVVAWNQLGCLSPHVWYVQDGGTASPEMFAELLAEILEQREASEPRGQLPTQAAATIASRRAIYEVRAAHSPATRLWQSKDSTSWTVVYEADARFQLSCLNRFIYVKPVKNLTEALQHADPVRQQVSTVALAVAPQHAADSAMELAAWGAARVCPVGRMQNPPLVWRHDARPALGDLVTWTDFELLT